MAASSLQPTQPTQAPRAWQSALVLAAAFLAFAARGPDNAPIHPDTARDRIMAQRDLNSEPARLRCTVGTWDGGVHGGAWPLHLEGLRHLGVPFEGVRLLSALAAALAVLALFLGAGAAWGQGAAWLAALAAAAAIGLPPHTFRVQWSPTLMPLPAAALALCLAAAARERTWQPYLAGALCLSLLCSLHLSSWAAVIPAALVMARFRPRRRPVAVLAAAAGLFLLSQLSLNLDADLANLDLLLGEGQGSGRGEAGLPWAMAAIFASGLAAWLLARTRCNDRSPVDALALLALLPTGAMTLLGLARGIPIPPRYGAVSMGALSLLFAAGATRLAPAPLGTWARRGLGLAGPVALAVVLALAQLTAPDLGEGPSRRLTFREVEDAAPALQDLDVISYEDALCKLRGPRLREVLVGLSVLKGYEPPTRLPAGGCPARDLAAPIWAELRGDALAFDARVAGLRWSEAKISAGPAREDLDPGRPMDPWAPGLLRPGYPDLLDTGRAPPTWLRLVVPSPPDLPETWGTISDCPDQRPCVTHIHAPTRAGEDFVFEWELPGGVELQGVVPPPVREYPSEGWHPRPRPFPSTEAPTRPRSRPAPRVLTPGAGPTILAAAENAALQTGIHLEDVSLSSAEVTLRLLDRGTWRELRMTRPPRGSDRRYLSTDGAASSPRMEAFAAALDQALIEDPWRTSRAVAEAPDLHKTQEPTLPLGAATIERLHPATFPWLSYSCHWLLMLSVIWSLAVTPRPRRRP